MLTPQAQWTPLHIATSAGHLDIVLLLLDTGLVDVNAVNGQEQTALFYAVSKNRIEVRGTIEHSRATH